jgi:glycosyltransferase involved in cell wall biosynthesis
MSVSDNKVSVCLPVFNGARYLAAAIESVLAQTHENLELLIVDDLSTDDSADIARTYAAGDSRLVYWQNERNLGIFANYNECLKRVSGSFIKLFAQDDVFEPDCLEALWGELCRHEKLALVTAARKVIDEKGQETSIERFYDRTTIIPGDEVIGQYMKTFVYRSGTPSQVMFRRNAIGAGFDTRYTLSGDIEYFFRILQSGDYMYLDRPLVKFRRHGDSATVSSLKDMSFLADALRLCQKFESYSLPPTAQSGTPVRESLIEGLIRKVNNAVYDRKIELTIASHSATTGNGNADKLDYERMACELLLYASQTKMELEEEQRSVKRAEQELIEQTSREKLAKSQVERELASAKQKLHDLQNSNSWRLTQPIRWLSRVLQ